MRKSPIPRLLRRALLLAGLTGALALPAAAQQKPAEIKLGIATFLSGPASVFGVPGRRAADMLIEEINQAGGIQGVPLRAIYIDENPGIEPLVGEFRRVVQNERADLMMAAISSGSCLALAPLAEELKKPTLLWDCGTQRIFEERKYEYVFRTQANGTPEVLAPLLYLLKTKPNFRTLAVVNQDYAWGRDSWEIFRTALQALKPDVRIVAELFPRFGATDFSTEITRLLALRPDVVFSTSWGGDLDTFIRQAAERRLFERTTYVNPLAESSFARVGKTLPAGHIVGQRGDHWFLHPNPARPQELARFTEAYVKRYNEQPIYATHHMYQALSAVKAAYAKALAATGGAWPNDAQLAAAFRGLTFDSPTGTVTIREDGQGLEAQLIGTSFHSDRYPFPVMTDMIVFPPELVYPPAGQNSIEWLKTLKPEILDRIPAAVPFR
jgi:branched-chain amino acid transport system substrate-binding protein